MMRAHKQQVTIVRKSESSAENVIQVNKRKRKNRISMSDENTES